MRFDVKRVPIARQSRNIKHTQFAVVFIDPVGTDTSDGTADVVVLDRTLSREGYCVGPATDEQIVASVFNPPFGRVPSNCGGSTRTGAVSKVVMMMA